MATLQELVEATSDAARELAEVSLGLGVTIERGELPSGLTGGYIALVGDESCVEIGIAADERNCVALAQALLQMDEELTESDVADALGEIANIMGGGVKKRLVRQHPGMQLGLPLVVRGRLLPGDRQQVAYVGVRLGDIPAQLVILQKKEG